MGTVVYETTYKSGEEFGDPGSWDQTHTAYGVRRLDGAGGVTMDSVGPSPASRVGGRVVRWVRKVGDPEGTGALWRSEIQYSHHDFVGRYRWYGFSSYFPSNWLLGGSTGIWRVLWQLHAGSGQPMVSFEYDNAVFSIKRRVGTNTSKTTIRNNISVPLDEWIDWVISARWRTSNDGRLVIWMNGEQLVNIQNVRTVPVSNISVYDKQGIYHTYTSNGSGVQYSDYRKVWDASSASEDLYDTVTISEGPPPVEPEPPTPPSPAMQTYINYRSYIPGVFNEQEHESDILVGCPDHRRKIWTPPQRHLVVARR